MSDVSVVVVETDAGTTVVELADTLAVIDVDSQTAVTVVDVGSLGDVGPEGPVGPPGEPGIEVGPTPPADTDMLWADTTATGVGDYVATFPYFNVKDYGAVGDGVTDDSDAFLAWVEAIQSTQQPAGGEFPSVEVPHVIGYVPTGRYVITKPGALLNASTWITDGWHIRGDGRMMSVIYFNPTVAGALVVNPSTYRNVHIENMGFEGGGPLATFCDSQGVASLGGAQDNYYHNCWWGGEWKDGFNLWADADANNNDCWVFQKCSMWAEYTGSFLVCGSGAGGTGQDNYVNFDFIGCSVVVYGGNFLNFIYGGFIRIIGGSWLMIGTGTLFVLDTPQHWSGATSFQGVGMRVELRDGKLLVCNWAYGNVGFLNCHFDAYIIPNTKVISQWFGSDDTGATLVWDNCRMAGTQEYKYTEGTWNAPAASIVYRNCYVPHADLRSSVLITEVGAVNFKGAIPTIEFQRCTALYTYGPEAQRGGEVVANWHQNFYGEVTPRFRNFKALRGGYPNDFTGHTWTMKFPPGAAILSIWFYAPPKPDHHLGATWSFTVSANAGAGAVTLATVSGGGTIPMTAGWNSKTVLATPWVCDTTPKRTLTFTSADNGYIENLAEVCVVEYLPGS